MRVMMAIAVVGSALGAEPMRSGPQPGQKLPAMFHVLNLNGPEKGKNSCPV